MEHGRRGVVSDVERRFPSLVAVVALALPVVGLALLLARPELDVQWQHQPSHFWLVLATAALSVVLALGTNEAASRRADGYRPGLDGGLEGRPGGGTDDGLPGLGDRGRHQPRSLGVEEEPLVATSPTAATAAMASIPTPIQVGVKAKAAAMAR